MSITNHNHSPAVPNRLPPTDHPSCGSPTFSIEDFGSQNANPFSPLGIAELVSSPQHYGGPGTRERERSIEKSGSLDRLSVSPAGRDSGGEDEGIHISPSSPLLTAVREAVDSLSQYQDFEILEKIGAGFFAEVFKVCVYCIAINSAKYQSGCL